MEEEYTTKKINSTFKEATDSKESSFDNEEVVLIKRVNFNKKLKVNWSKPSNSSKMHCFDCGVQGHVTNQ